jgi:lysophospholipase L1-like esterase
MRQENNMNRRQFIGRSTCVIAGFVLLPERARATNKPDTDFFRIRGGIPNSQYFFNANIVGNQYLFFIGNSVLEGRGLKDPGLRYSALMTKGFKKYFPETNMPETRQMQPGGSWFAQYRCSGGQPVFGEVIFSGHLAILDFAADDRQVAIEQVKCTMEAIIRQIVLFRNTHSRILVYTLTPEMLQSYREGKTPEYIRICEQLADHYNIPSLNLAEYAAARIIAGEISETAFSADGIHPTDAGAGIYADAVAQFVDALMTACPVPDNPAPVVLPGCLFPGTNDQGRIVAYENPVVALSGSWKSGQKSPILPFRHLLVSDKPGDTLTLKFKGSEIGIIDVVDKDSADFEYSIDGAPFQKFDSPKEVSVPTMRPVPLVKGMNRDIEHKLVLKIASPGVARLGGLLLNGTVEDVYAGMSAIEQIDAIYATMDPVVYNPPAGRFTHIPKTKRTLAKGGDLRMVLLGDSIMGNTSASLFELLLMRDYPACNVVKIPSLRSSTGCQYYKEENRVQEYVLRHNPDILVIGGISNTDAESVRSVIRQVRAKRPGQEVLLLTPVFGAYNDEQVKEMPREIDATTSNFRHDMMKVAVDENCAFFDIAGPLWEYIRNSGKTVGWFMGDRVHANARGNQLIGRLLEAWFKGV